ncbi:programmed cell death protein 2 [Sabethes cyaneus]|uniref:programmed cell death protein 2 n=1 Tax=Sabethes cyaneus TaxID=53552 RepID=UPI00237E77FF|nr:programmed cell death protein 2 [Sabethes cyaneus]
METGVELGFVEPCEDWLLSNKFFRSKVGGKPAWLDLKNIPLPKDLLCEECGDPCVFLCQVYAPLDESERCFHRMLFLFVCLRATCYRPNQCNNILVYRSQLPRRNDYYDFDPPNEETRAEPVPSPVPLCAVCGCHGPQKCSRCKQANYCGVVHQRIDWKHGHKSSCSGEVNQSEPTKILFPQNEIVTEPEKIEQKSNLSEQENEQKQMEEYERLSKQGKTGELSELSESELDKYSEQVDDKTFARFRKRIEAEPEQVLRYDRKGSPLWISDVLPEAVPDCENCGAARVFEFQIMPQLLNNLDNSNIDWGTLAVYTCEQSCDRPDHAYAKEYVFKQDVSDTKPSQSSDN